MKIFRTDVFNIDAPSVVALGCFDGVHAGHVRVLEETVRIARELSLQSVVFSFESSPKNLFFPGSAPALTSPEEKAERIEAIGADVFISIPFTPEIAALSPESFFDEILMDKLCARHIVCGFNYTFGNKARGNAELLGRLCESAGISFSAVSPTLVGGVAVSSSAIREALRLGDTETARAYLGRAFSLSATVEHGNALGRTLGFPTLNQYFHKNTVLPRFGVYLTRILLDGKLYFGITNVGTHPTLLPDSPRAETYVFDFSGDVYGKEVRLEFLKFIRDEKKFDSAEELKSAVREDISTARKLSKSFDL